jgi:hypothetical protein
MLTGRHLFLRIDPPWRCLVSILSVCALVGNKPLPLRLGTDVTPERGRGPL